MNNHYELVSFIPTSQKTPKLWKGQELLIFLQVAIFFCLIVLYGAISLLDISRDHHSLTI